MRARIGLSAGEVMVELAQPLEIAIAQQFTDSQPRHFGAPLASSRPFAVEGFSGAVARGASCNCEVLTLNPHCNGTHTECVGHLTFERVAAHTVIPPGLIPAVLVSVASEPASECAESSQPAPERGDRLLTRRALEAAWPISMPFQPQALIIRSLPNDASKLSRDYAAAPPPYLSREAAELLVRRDIQHLVVDLPSLDRTHDGGALTAHRVFFGLDAGSQSLAAARRPKATVTELAYIPEEVHDGAYLLELQVPAFAGDAVPSRPLLYRLQAP